MNDRTALMIAWPGGERDEIGAALLRRECPSARARRARIEESDVVGPDVRISYVNPVGLYAVNIGFSDGEYGGVYPWTYLAQLAARYRAERLGASDFMIEGEHA
ncbi:MAG: DUF971 domain-containing protein [Hyphomicrobiales bacterium]|nr:DUF971 domain-containing protein [Hyphomicrobiales bacterium]